MNKKSVVKVFFTAAFLGATGLFYSCNGDTDAEVMIASTQSPQPSSNSKEVVLPSVTIVSSSKVYVYICGQVKKPEVYELDVGARVKDIVELAGGFTKQAAPECVNLARVVVDGEQIYIPSLEEKKKGNYTNTEEIHDVENKSGNQAKESLSVNINYADSKELMTLPGIGEAKAAAILAYREEHGLFRSKEELMNIVGIKTGLFSKIKDYIKVN